MSDGNNIVENNILEERFRFLLEVIIIFLGIFLFLLIPRYLLYFVLEENTTFFGPIYYLLRALALIFAIPIFLYFSKLIVEPKKISQKYERGSNPIKEYLNLYKLSKKDYKDQFLNGILLLFIIFIPLDFFVYFFIPQMLEYTGNALTSQATDSYLLQSYLIFIISVIIIQISVSIYEECLTRGFLTFRGKEYFHKMSAVVISSLYFGLMHFAYYLNPISRNYPIWFPIIWFLQTFLVAIILSILILKKKRLFPVIFAHAANNIISAHAVWNYLQGNDFVVITIYMYIPLLILSALIFIMQFSKIKLGISIVFENIKPYFKANRSIKESQTQVLFRIIIDLVIGIIILIIGLFIFGV